MGGGRDDVAVGERVARLPRGDQAGDVSHVRHEVGANFVRDLFQKKINQEREEEGGGGGGYTSCTGGKNIGALFGLMLTMRDSSF